MTLPWIPERWDDEVDIVVAGFGGAGSCAAIAAHDAGARVLVLEKAPTGGGNTGCCGGGMRVPADVASAVEFYGALTHGTVEAESIRALAEAMHALPERLRQWGAQLEYLPRGLDHPGLPGAAAFGMVVSIDRTPEQKAAQARAGGPVFPTRGDTLFRFLAGQVTKRNIEVRYRTAVTALVQDPITKEILGVRAADAARGRALVVKARKGVVLACGGFQNNAEMLVNYLPFLTRLPVVPYGTPHNTGDGITMAAEAGAKLWHMSGCELGQFAPRAPSEHFGVGFRLEKQLRKGGQAIYVNRYGRRFMDESVLLSHRKDLFRVQEFDSARSEYPNVPFYMVFDDAFRRQRPIVGFHMGWWCIQGVYEWSADNSAEIERGWIVEADSIAALGRRIGVDAAALARTVDEYNAGCRQGVDAAFGRHRDWLAPLQTPPYYATELCEPIINTQGGPKHNRHAQVLDRNDRPIPRLYAAGELGSFFFPLYESASNVPEALAFGCIAGEHASALRAWG